MVVHGQLRISVPQDDGEHSQIMPSESPAAGRSRSNRGRRERPRISLDPNQPPTTQGKPRARVFIACLQCRRRKIRCDGAKPSCFNCNERAIGDECCYDPSPKRRGPDRVQGARTRGARPQDSESARPRRRRRRSPPSATDEGELSPTSAAVGSSEHYSSVLELHALPTAIYVPPASSVVLERSSPTYTPVDLLYQHTRSDASPHSSLDAYEYASYDHVQPHAPLTYGQNHRPHYLVEPLESNARYTSAYDYPASNPSMTFSTNDLSQVSSHAQAQGVPSLPLLPSLDFTSSHPPQSDFFHTTQVQSAYIEPEDSSSDDTDDTSFPGPSVDFSRRTWWDHLLAIYCHSSVTPTPTTRKAAAQGIFRDVKFLFQKTSYHFSFLHARRFYSSITDPRRRPGLQSSLVLAALAMSKLLQSSTYGEGQIGMQKALMLRREAQAALDASLSTGAINEELAQAAWILAYFEQSSHPESSRLRVRSSLHLLDSIVHMLALTCLDAGNPQASAYEPRTVPTVHTSPAPSSSNINVHPARSVVAVGVHGSSPSVASPTWSPSFANPLAHMSSHSAPITAMASSYTGATAGGASQHVASSQPRRQPCGCDAITHGVADPSAKQWTPMWTNQPAWQNEWSESEIRRESCRRLAWMSVALAAGYTSYATAIGHPPFEASIIEPSNLTLLFPGETLGSGKESVWALYIRAMLLWHSYLCAQDRIDSSFTASAWLESEAIERALNAHTCQVERALMYHGREYLFNTRMAISYDFQRYIPQPLTGVNREKAQDWLRTQGQRAKYAARSLGDVTGHGSALTILQRPYFVWWFMGQVQRALKLWALDKSLTVALEVCRDFMVPIEFLGQAYPIADGAIKCKELQAELDAAFADARANGYTPHM